MEVGRRTVDLKICSCPGRDMSNEEEGKQLTKEKRGRKCRSPSDEPYHAKRLKVYFLNQWIFFKKQDVSSIHRSIIKRIVWMTLLKNLFTKMTILSSQFQKITKLQ